MYHIIIINLCHCFWFLKCSIQVISLVSQNTLVSPNWKSKLINYVITGEEMYGPVVTKSVLTSLDDVRSNRVNYHPSLLEDVRSNRGNCHPSLLARSFGNTNQLDNRPSLSQQII